jgi:hypothetical protein
MMNSVCAGKFSGRCAKTMIMNTPSGRAITAMPAFAAAGAPARDATAAGRIGRVQMVTSARSAFQFSPLHDRHGGYAFQYSPPGDARYPG